MMMFPVFASICAALFVATWAYLLHRATVLELVLRSLLAAIDEQGSRDDDMERLDVAVQAARRLVGQ